MDERPSIMGTRLCVSVRSTVRPRYNWFRAQHQALLRDGEPTNAVGLAHVQDDLFVHHQLVMQGQVIAVRIQMPFFERIDHDISAQLLANFESGKNHGTGVLSW